PAKHPAPERAAMLDALRETFPQYWWLARSEPHWFPITTVAFGAFGLLVMAVRRPWLLARTLLTLVLAFTLLAHDFTHDELVSARYFLFTIPIALIAAGFGFDALVQPLVQRLRTGRAWAIGAAWLLLAGVSVLVSRHAYAARYAFQDEYSFVRDAA